MKIAVTYENGEVFQHFGHCEAFKVYDVAEGQVVSTEMIDANGSGHGALATLLADHQIDVLICGGLGGGAMNALAENGIEVYAGATGNADEAVALYLKGELEDSGVNCDHHGDHGCGDEATCGGHEGCHGCHSQPAFEGKNVGKTLRVHYRGTFDDGTQFDSSYDRGEPLEFICGAGMMIIGFDMAVADMAVGDRINVHLTPEAAYGPYDPRAVFPIPMAQMPGTETLKVGDRVALSDMQGRRIPVTVTAKDETTITFDANHQLAGKELNFDIELVEIVS